MHPALTHELTRAVLADRERDARRTALVAAAAAGRRQATDRPFLARRPSRARRVGAMVARLRAQDGTPASAR
jgi:hypothetical protein